MSANCTPTFKGQEFAHNASVTSMDGFCSPVLKSYPRNIGVVIRDPGVVYRTLGLRCVIVPPETATRSDIENFMNDLNEGFVCKGKSDLFINGNTFKNCAIESIDYDTTFRNLLLFDANFVFGQQAEDATCRQIILKNFSSMSRGRAGTFTTSYGDNAGNVLHIFNNVDIFRHLRANVRMKAYENREKYVDVDGSYEEINCLCWAYTNVEIDWKQSIEGYIYNIMFGPLGDIGTLVVNETEIENCMLTGVKLNTVHPTSASYELTFIASLQC